jgi:hypothetical protein
MREFWEKHNFRTTPYQLTSIRPGKVMGAHKKSSRPKIRLLSSFDDQPYFVIHVRSLTFRAGEKNWNDFDNLSLGFLLSPPKSVRSDFYTVRINLTFSLQIRPHSDV